MLPWQPKHHTISDFTKNGIFYEKGIFKANYLLPARQNMNNFKHILHNIHLQYKHKITVFKIPDNSYHGDRNCQKRLNSVAKIFFTKNEVCPRKNVKLTLFRLAFVIQVLLITLTTRSVKRLTLVVHKILVKMKHAICIMFPSSKCVTMETNFQHGNQFSEL